MSLRIAPSTAARARGLLSSIQAHPPSCPCHSNPAHHFVPSLTSALRTSRSGTLPSNKQSQQQRRPMATPVDVTQTRDNVFEMAASTIRFGPGATAEVGMDLAGMGAKRVCLVTDENVGKLEGIRVAQEAMAREGVEFVVFDGVRVEPKDYSVQAAIDYARSCGADAYLAIGGGSVIDTAKLMNLYSTYPGAALLDFVPVPLGRGLQVDRQLKPLIAIPTTAGTGSETTGTAIFDLATRSVKTGVSHRRLRPTLGICDPLNVRTLPRAVAASSGLDVLCHALESWTAIPFNTRTPRPQNPLARPAYQGANPISDVFALHALRATAAHLPRAAKNPDDIEARDQMLLAATLAGVGFGNAGVHLCHGMSYPISGNNPAAYQHGGYAISHPLIPHGVSVAVSAPAVFRFTAPADPDRHLVAAEAFGVDTTNVKRENAGEVLAEALQRFLDDFGDQPRGLRGLGFGPGDVDKLVEGTVPQGRVLGLAPQLEREQDGMKGELRTLFEDAMSW